MNKLLLSATIVAMSMLPLNAGTLTEPAVEEMVEMEETGGSSSGILIPLLILAGVVALVASNNDDDECNPREEKCASR